MKRIILIVFLLVGLGFSTGVVSENYEKKPQWGGSETVPVHLIPLKDEFDQVIIPTELNPLPFSSRYTCAPCHDYSTIQAGLHFSRANSATSERPVEPWFWMDEKTGIVLPLSYRRWKGTWHPDDLGIDSWDFALRFGRHMTGGGILEPPEDEMSAASRWNVSGKVEINCMGCHNVSRMQNHTEWAKQILRENFRWAATASAGLGEVGGMASRLSATWDLFDGPNPDDTEWAIVPFIRYNTNLFNSNHQVFFDITDKPLDGRCLTCHSVTPVKLSRKNLDPDVHSAAGLLCVDCHRNGIEHEMLRGYEGETSLYYENGAETLTCRGCHIGSDQKKSGSSTGGRLGAPYPTHRGLPAVHLERLTCTVCHSVPWPDKDLIRVRTSRANRLGIFGVARWETDLPQIFEPVYVKEGNGKITPHRLVWPSFWGKVVDGKTIPLLSENILAHSAEVFASEDNVAQVLLALYREPDLGGIPVLVMEGKMYALNVDGGLDVSDALENLDVEGVMWALKTEKNILPLIPEFDPDAEMIDVDAEVRVQIVLQALATNEFAPGQPVLLIRNTMYFIQEGYLETTKNPGEDSPLPKLFWLVEGHPEPLVQEFDLRTVKATVGREQTLTEEQVKLVLENLTRTFNSDESENVTNYAYFSGGLMFFLDSDGELTTKNHKSADPVTWPIGHRVRPAQQSLGINGCRDCHRVNSPFFFGRVEGTGPLITDRNRARSQVSFMGLTVPYQRLFGLSFSVRPLFKIVLFVAALVLFSIVLIVLLLKLGRISGLVEKRR